MRTLRAWLARVIGFVRPRHGEREFADELQSHIDLHVADNLRAGMTPEEARRRALAKLGSVASVSEAHRDRRGLPRTRIPDPGRAVCRPWSRPQPRLRGGLRGHTRPRHRRQQRHLQRRQRGAVRAVAVREARPADHDLDQSSGNPPRGQRHVARERARPRADDDDDQRFGNAAGQYHSRHGADRWPGRVGERRPGHTRHLRRARHPRTLRAHAAARRRSGRDGDQSPVLAAAIWRRPVRGRPRPSAAAATPPPWWA